MISDKTYVLLHTAELKKKQRELVEKQKIQNLLIKFSENPKLQSKQKMSAMFVIFNVFIFILMLNSNYARSTHVFLGMLVLIFYLIFWWAYLQTCTEKFFQSLLDSIEKTQSEIEFLERRIETLQYDIDIYSKKNNTNK